jgi:hypothetical protein
MHLLLALAPGITIRGTTTPHAPGQAFSVYDFIDAVAVCGQSGLRKQRGGFSRRMWARLMSSLCNFRNELQSLSWEAPIRFSSRTTRTFDAPVMTACGLLSLLVIVTEELRWCPCRVDEHHTVRTALTNLLADDHSVVRKIEKDTAGGDAAISHSDLLLRLTPETAVRGATIPGVIGQVFSVHDFIDIVCRQLSRLWKTPRSSRMLWSRLTSKKSVLHQELEYLSFRGKPFSMKNSLKSKRRFLTPAMHVSGLHRLLRLMDFELRSRGYQTTSGCPKVSLEIDRRVRDTLETIFARYNTGNHSIIEQIGV